jgi:glycosyltransferase involved in cell wall biosynthesis
MANTQPKHIVIDARNRRASTGRYTDRLVEHLQKLDHTNRYTILVEPDDPWKFENKNFTPRPCNFRQFSFNPLDQIRFSWQLYRLKPDLVHFTMTQQPLFYFGNIVTTTHDLTMLHFTRPSRFPGWLHKIGIGLYRFLLWWSHRKSKKILMPTEYSRRALEAYQPFTKKKIEVIYLSSEPPIAGDSQKIPGLEHFIFHVGSPFPHKNIKRLIEAFQLVKKTHPDLQLVLPGKIKDQFKRDMDQWLADSPVRADIIGPGFVSDQELKWLYENAAAYVVPSLSEGFGLPGLEAMAHGCPLASSNATCLPEVYGEAAHYFNPKDTKDMARAITELLSNTKLGEALKQKGFACLKKYSWKKTAEQTLAVYKSVL